VQHVEFFHKKHFTDNYHRTAPAAALQHFIDFFWETDFDALWDILPNGFSDVLFPNVGYTYLINLANPFVMQVGETKFEMKSDGFLPRHKAIECYHRPGNRLFGVKFRIAPVLFEKKVNFAEYRHYIFPLSYLIESRIVQGVKTAGSFCDRVTLLNHYFTRMIKQHAGSLPSVDIVREILHCCEQDLHFNVPVKKLAEQYGISTRTLQRYFESATSLSTKGALQILRIRKAADQLANRPGEFDFTDYGYYDYSHFYKHLRRFFNRKTLESLQLPAALLKAAKRTTAGNNRPLPALLA
jgi:AraC-like DNA-binding protein